MAPDVLISTQLITKSYGTHPLFSDVSLQVCAGERLGLIGPNGAGKSTLLRILDGLGSADSGEISRRRGTCVVYLPQEDALDPARTVEQTLAEALPSTLAAWEAGRRRREILSLIEVDDSGRTVATLSGGWRKRLAIGQALLRQPNLLLMDEPTNHLDLEGILWLEKLLKDAPFAFVLVSHDRFFLEQTTNRIVELDRRYAGGLLKVEGNYSTFVERREHYLLEQAKHTAVLSNKVRREIEWLRQGAKARTTKAKHRIDQAHRLQEDLAAVKGRNAAGRSVEIAFDATGRRTRILLSAEALGMHRGGRCLFENLDLKLTPGLCLGILGANGTGKSTLIQVLNGTLAPGSGRVHTADGLKIVSFDQKRELADPGRSLREVLSPEGDTVVYRGRPFHVTAWAKRFGFRPEQLGMPAAGLSGGEKACVLIADLMRQPADILLLDEPTNDLDIPTLEVLEESLEEFAGAVVLITHDRFLMERLCDRLLCLDGKGGAFWFADHRQWLESLRPPGGGAPVKDRGTASVSEKKPQKLAYETRKAVERIQRQIEKAEAVAADLERRLQDPAIQCDAQRLARLYEEHQQAEENVAALYRHWEALEAGAD